MRTLHIDVIYEPIYYHFEWIHYKILIQIVLLYDQLYLSKKVQFSFISHEYLCKTNGVVYIFIIYMYIYNKKNEMYLNYY